MFPKSPYNPPDTPFEVVFEDETLLGISKPAGLLSVPGKTDPDCLQSRLAETYPDALLIHRLDMDTSGLMVFARDKAAQRHLGLQFERRHLEKTYLAVITGEMANTEGVVDLPLIVDWPNRPLQKVCHETGKQSRTAWRVIEKNAAQTRVELRPETGRTHQLRVHMAALGHPILGDPFYGNKSSAPRMLLHAERLELYHPVGGARITMVAPCPF